MSAKKYNCGIYQIVNLINGKRYVGSTSNLKSREYHHFQALKMGYHRNPHLQNSYRKYGAKAFVFSVLVYCSEVHLLFFEQLILDGLRLVEVGYNICEEVSRPPKIEYSLEVRKKISSSNMGRAGWNEGKPCPCSTKQKLSKVKSGRKMGKLNRQRKLGNRKSISDILEWADIYADDSLYFLGNLCVREHEYKGSGKSVRYISNKACVECRALIDNKSKKRGK